MHLSARNRSLLIMLIVAVLAVLGLSGRIFTRDATAAPPRPPVPYDPVLLANEPPVDEIIVKYADSITTSDPRRTSYYTTAGGVQTLDERLSTAAGMELVTVQPMSTGAWVMRMPREMSVVEAGAITNNLQALSYVDYAHPSIVVNTDDANNPDVADELVILGDEVTIPDTSQLIPDDANNPESPNLVPLDVLFPQQWHYFYSDGSNERRLEGANLLRAWNITTGSPNTVVAVVDTGIIPFHVEFAGKLVPGYDFISDPVRARDGNARDANPLDEGNWHNEGDCGDSPSKASNWHGTHVAGTIGARTGVDVVGVAGVNWQTRLLPVRVLGRCGGDFKDIVDGTMWAAGLPVPDVARWQRDGTLVNLVNPNPAQVINLSLGGPSSTCPADFQRASDLIAQQTNATIVVAAGNDFINAAGFYPANCYGVIAVASTTVVGSLAGYSNWGNVVDISATGGDGDFKVLSTVNDSPTTPSANPAVYGWLQGTSMAAPHVAGVASLLYGRNPFITASQVRQTLQFSARAFPQDLGGINCNKNFCGSGILDAFNSVLVMPGTPTPTPTATVTNTPIPAATLTPTPTNTPLPTATQTQTPTPTPGMGQITIVKEANPPDGTDFVFSASGVPQVSYSFAWGSEGTAPGQMDSPTGVAVNKAGFVYVADRDNHRIQKFSAAGGLVGVWGGLGTGNGQFNEPYGIALDSAGNVYVSDRLNHRIQKFDADGTYIRKWGTQGTGNGQFEQPHGVAVDSNDVIYVADHYNDRIQKFNANGVYQGQWGTTGSGNGQMSEPDGIAVDKNGNVYVGDADNHRIQRFDTNGTYILQWGNRGTGLSQFEFPTGVTVDGIGDVWVMDQFNHRIHRFGPDGTILGVYGIRGPGPEQFDLPNGLATDSSGAMYVADLGNDRIQKLNGSVFSLDQAVPEDFDQVNSSRTFTGLLPKGYEFREAELPAGWSLTTISCDSGSWTVDQGQRMVTVDLGPTDNVTCTFKNQKNTLGQPTATPVGVQPTATPTLTPTPFPTVEIIQTPEATMTPTVTVTPDTSKQNTETLVDGTDPAVPRVGQPFEVFVRVFPAVSGEPTGTVVISNGEVSCDGSATPHAEGGVSTMSCTLASLTSGVKTLTATYGGSTIYNGSSGTRQVTVVEAGIETTTTIDRTFPSPSQVGEAVTVVAIVDRATAAGDITGIVTFSDGTTTCQGGVGLGDFGGDFKASCNLTFSTAGVKNLTATYSGDAAYGGSSGTGTHIVGNIDFTDFAYLPGIFNPGNALKQLAFVSDRDGDDEIYIMNEDGSDLLQLTSSPGRDGSPAWSPDGQWLAFYSERDGDADIYVVRANGTGLRKLTNNTAFDCCMDWSPDGTKIVFNSNWPDGDQDIYVINVDGTGLKNLTNAPGDDWSPDWSPGGGRIAFDSNRDGQSEIYVMNADGSGVSRLTNLPSAQRAPDWSSDGQEIVYSSDQQGVDNLFKMRSNGTQQLLMASSPADDKWPDWMKGGQAILFTSYRDGNGELYVITSNGTGLRRLTTHPANDFGGVWRP